MKKVLLALVVFLMITGQSWATLTATKVPVTKTGGSTPALQDSDLTDVLGVSVTSSVPLAASNFSTDTGLTANSDALIPTQRAVKTYVQGITGISTPLATNLGGTGSTSSSNGANGVVVLNGSTQLPAVSAALLTNIPYWPYVKVSETQTSGTDGGTSSSGSWITRVINTKDTDTGSIASIATNQITLPAGTYLVSISSPFFTSALCQIRLENITDSSLLLTGTSGDAVNGTTAGVMFVSTIKGVITLAGTKALAVQYQVSSGQATNGLGKAASFGTEVYTVAEFTKIQ